MPWRRLAVPIYGPTALVAAGSGAILPLVALSARELGASVGVAALMVGLIGLGQLIGDLPAGALAARIGEKSALIGACLLDAVALLGAFLAQTVWTLAVAVFVTGLAGAVFSLARQAYLTEAVPIAVRARAMSTLGWHLPDRDLRGSVHRCGDHHRRGHRHGVRVRRGHVPGRRRADRPPA